MSDPFARYMMPAAISAGIKIPLDGTPAVFTVRPPSNNYDAYYSAFSAALTQGRAPGDTSVTTAQMIKARKEAFLEACIEKAEGLPDGMDAQAFFKAYPLALKVVFKVAVEAAEEVDASIEEGLGNSSASRSGPINGAAVRKTTKTSKRRVSSPQSTAALN